MQENIQRKIKKLVIPWMRRKICFVRKNLATLLKGLEYNKAPGADTVVNELLQYGSLEVRN